MFRTRITAVAAAAAITLGGGLVVAPAALADGPETPRSTTVAIEALAWPHLKHGDNGWQTKTAENLIGEWTGSSGNFDEGFEESLRDFQAEKDLPVTSELDPETWGEVRRDFGVVRSGAPGYKVHAVQTMLLEGQGYDVAVDGDYGAGTVAAVRRFQTANGIDADGEVGPITFRALVTGGV